MTRRKSLSREQRVLMFNLVDPKNYGGPVDGFVAYIRDIDHVGNSVQCEAMIFIGRKNKPEWYYRFDSIAAAMAQITLTASRHAEYLRHKEEVRAKKAAWVPNIKIGDVFGTSWGWDQTNREFYEVVDIPSPKTVLLSELETRLEVDGNQAMTGRVYPQKGKYTGEKFQKRLIGGPDGTYIKFASYRTGSIVDLDKRPSYNISWYG